MPPLSLNRLPLKRQGFKLCAVVRSPAPGQSWELHGQNLALRLWEQCAGVSAFKQAPCAHRGQSSEHVPGLWTAALASLSSLAPPIIFFAFLANFCPVWKQKELVTGDQREDPFTQSLLLGKMSLILSASTFPSAKWGEGILPASFAEQMGPPIHPRAQKEGCLQSMWGSSSKTHLPVTPGRSPNSPLHPTPKLGAVSSLLSVVLSILLRIALSNLLLRDYLFLRFFLPQDSESS